MRYRGGVAVMLLVAVGVRAEDHPVIVERPALLKALGGQWQMDGDVLGEPVSYRMVAGPTLQGTFTEIHMDDVQVPSPYEARMLIGVDSDGTTITARWMDSFGAKYSIPHGSGVLSATAIQFSMPYASGPLHDTVPYHAQTDSWLFVLEGEHAAGRRKHFARYRVYRR